MLRQSRIKLSTRSKFFILSTSSALLLLGLLAALPVPPVNSQTNRDEINQASATRPCSTCPEPTQQTIYAPIIGLPEATGSEIVLNCRSPHVMSVVPTFYTAEGTPIVGQTIQLQPAEIRFVSVDALIPEEHRGQHRWGGMSLSYTGRFMEVWAQLTLHGVGRRNSVDVLFTVINSPRSNVREAIWRMPPGSTAAIALGNFSEVPTRATLTFSNGETQEVSIEPFATEIVRRSANRRGGEGESVTINSSGPVGRLITSGFVTTADGSFTSSIRFSDTPNVGQPNLYATNFRLRNTVPRLLLKNTTTATVSARPRFLPAAGEVGDPVELPSVSVPPNGVVAVNLRPLIAAAGRREDLASVSVQIINSGAPGSLIGALYSTDIATGIMYDVPFRDIANPRTSTGGYPVRLEGDFTTVLSITNVNSVPSRFTMRINFEGGSYALHPREIAAGATAVFDLRRLRDEQTPDSTGRTLPHTLTIGQIRWSVHGDDSTRLVGRAEVVSRSRRVSNSYSCMCCPDSLHSVRVIPERVTVVVGDTPQFFAMQRDMDCYGGVFGEYGASAYYTSGDDSIASVGYWTGLATAIGSGVSYVQGTWTAYEWREDLHGTCESTPVEMTPIADMLVRPRIDSISPERGLVGTTVNVTISGQGFLSGQTSINAGAGIVASNVTVNSSTQLTANFAIDVNAAGGNRSVTVTVNGMTSNSRNFFVQVPTSLRVLSQRAFRPPNGCGGPEVGGFLNGFQASIRYQVLDQTGQNIVASLPLRENIYNVTAGGEPGPGEVIDGLVTLSGTTEADGTFLDEPVGVCARLPFGAGTLTQELFIPLSPSVRLFVRTNNFTLSGRPDCGNFTNGVDINVSVPCS